jgi:signal transduction histidine kinase
MTPSINTFSPTFPPFPTIKAADSVDLHRPPLKMPRIQLVQPRVFSAALLHEVRNPLANINLSIAILQSMVNNDDLNVYFEVIQRSSARINSLITESLTYPTTNQPHTEICSLQQLLDEVFETTRDRILLKNIMVKRDYTNTPCEVTINRKAMVIALSNIIINAVDAMDDSTGELRLSITTMDCQYKILIHDNGCGISKENLPYIFKPYFTNKPGGLGLGLSTTYEILHANQAEVIVASEEKAGTQVSVIFNKPV